MKRIKFYDRWNNRHEPTIKKVNFSYYLLLNITLLITLFYIPVTIIQQIG